MNERNISRQNGSVQSSKYILTTIIAIVFTATIFGGGVYAWQKSILRTKEISLQLQIRNLQNQIAGIQRPAQSTSNTSTEMNIVTLEESQFTGATTKWKTYTNSTFKFELKVPSQIFSYQEHDDRYNRLVAFNSGKENFFEVRIYKAKNIHLNQYRYFDFDISSTSTLGGEEALVFEAPNGYCDGPGCGYPFIAYSTKYGDDFYNLIFYGDIKISDTEKFILSSFRFTK